jgi:hypothetical protein
MSHYLTRVQTWYCDHPGCNNSYEGHGPAHEVWRAARKSGWTVVPHNRHGCPDHPLVMR